MAAEAGQPRPLPHLLPLPVPGPLRCLRMALPLPNRLVP